MIALLDSTNVVAPSLEPTLHARLPETVLEIFSSFDGLRQRLSHVGGEPVIAILAPERRDRLEQFKELLNLFSDVKIVLILPDSNPETVRLGHQLYPRFIGYREGDFDALVSVVVRMYERMQKTAIQ